MTDTPSTFLRSSHPIDIYMGADRTVRSELIFSHIKVVGWIYVEDGILQKAFLPTKITNFSDRLRTTLVAVCGSCSSLIPVKVNHRHLFSDTFRFSCGDFSDPFPSVPVGDYIKKAHRSDPNTYTAICTGRISCIIQRGYDITHLYIILQF